MDAVTTFAGAAVQEAEKQAILQDLACIPLLQLTQYEPGTFHPGPNSEWVCQLLKDDPAANGKSGKILKLEDIYNLPEGIVQQFESAESLLTITGAVVAGNSIKVPKGAAAKIEKKSKRTKGSKGGDNDAKGSQADTFDTAGGSRSIDNIFDIVGRRLQTDNVNKKVLVIRVKATGGMTGETTSSAAEISNEVFGTAGDPFNMVSQYAACSYNKLTFSPLMALNPGDPSLDAVGVYQVEVTAPSTNHETLREAVTDKLNEDWPNTPLPSVSFGELDVRVVPFDHVMVSITLLLLENQGIKKTRKLTTKPFLS